MSYSPMGASLCADALKQTAAAGSRFLSVQWQAALGFFKQRPNQLASFLEQTVAPFSVLQNSGQGKPVHEANRKIDRVVQRAITFLSRPEQILAELVQGTTDLLLQARERRPQLFIGAAGDDEFQGSPEQGSGVRRPQQSYSGIGAALTGSQSRCLKVKFFTDFPRQVECGGLHQLDLSGEVMNLSPAGKASSSDDIGGGGVTIAAIDE